MQKLKILTYNVHKGRSQVLRKYKVESLKDALIEIEPDIVFLQEVNGLHPKKHNANNSPIETLAEELFPYHVYGKNAEYKNGHHGNAILSKFPILSHDNIEISETKLASRGLLHASVQIGIDSPPLELLCVHLDLFEKARQRQYQSIAKRIHSFIPDHTPFILAGDFNDWRNRFEESLMEELNIKPCTLEDKNKPALTYPARLPVFPLDRIYARHFDLKDLVVLKGKPWTQISDHLPLLAELKIKT